MSSRAISIETAGRLVRRAALAVVSAWVLAGCGAAPAPAGEAPAAGGERPQAPDAGTAEAAAEEGIFGDEDPCARPSKALDAEPLDGPFESIEAACEKRGIEGCEAVGPTASFPGDDAPVADARVVRGSVAGGERAFVALAAGGSWFAGPLLGEADERVRHAGPLVCDDRGAGPSRLMIGVSLLRSGEDGGGRRRSVTAICSRGESGAPSCAVLPDCWEWLGPDGEVVEEKTTRLRHLSCQDGTFVIYGNLSRLPEEIAKRARRFVGRHYPRFP
ncbi:MAG: hypothetical protein R6V85_00205 [Polyangia bacterium]